MFDYLDGRRMMDAWMDDGEGMCNGQEMKLSRLFCSINIISCLISVPCPSCEMWQKYVFISCISLAISCHSINVDQCKENVWLVWNVLHMILVQKHKAGKSAMPKQCHSNSHFSIRTTQNVLLHNILQSFVRQHFVFFNHFLFPMIKIGSEW